jgi:hypothetical protein
MLYDHLVDIQCDLEWALFELQTHPGASARRDALQEAEAALDRLSAVIAFIDQRMQKSFFERCTIRHAPLSTH